MLRALARLGVEDAAEPFIRYLGRYLDWYTPDDQEIVDTAPEHFRHQLLNKALVLLQDAEHMEEAAHAVGYLKDEQAIASLHSHLEVTEWRNWTALVALVHIGTEEAFNVLEIALSEIGERIVVYDQQLSHAKDLTHVQNEASQERDEFMTILMEVRASGFYRSSLPVIIPFLIRLLEHPNIYIRHEAIQSLGELGASETALAIIKSRPIDDQRPGLGIIETLTAFGARIDIEPMLAIVNDPTSPELVVRDAIKALGVSRDKRVLEPLSAFIAQRQYLFDTIQALGDTRLPEAVPLLMQVVKGNAVDSTNSDGFNSDLLDDLVISNLGELQHPDAFEPIEHYARKHLPKVRHQTIGALTASGGDRAIPLLQEMWEYDPDKRRTILRALLWIETHAATDTIVELLQPIDAEKATLLAHALSRGKGLDFITGTAHHVGILETVDERLVLMLDAYFDEMVFDGKWQTLIAMKYIGTPTARQFLERIFNDVRYDEVLFPNARPGSFRTIRQAAMHMLYDLGSNVVIDAVLDTLLDQPAQVIEFRLRGLDYISVRDALQRRLSSAQNQLLIRFLTLLGTFGDHTVLPALQPYINDLNQEVADAAYTAEQLILGLAYL